MSLPTFSQSFDPALMAQVEQRVSAELAKRREKLGLETRLIDFLEAAWPALDSAEYQVSWAVDALCEHLEGVTHGHIRKLLINFPPRCTKPVAESALVMCKRGLIPLCEITVGDEVWTHKGRWRKASAVHQQGILPTLKIRTWTGREVEAASDHPFLTPEGWVELGKIRPHDVVGFAPLHVTKDDCGTNTISAEEARLLGYLVGDGSCGGTPNVTCADDVEAADIMHCIRAVGFMPYDYRYKMINTGAWLRRISIRAAEGHKNNTRKGARGPVRQWVDFHGLDRKSSYTKMVPDAVMRGSNEVVLNFLGAYWACDGFVTTKGTKRDGTERDDLYIGCDSVNKRFMQQIQMLLLRIGVDSRLRTKVNKRLKTKRQGESYTSYTVAISTQDDCWRFARAVKMYHLKHNKMINARIRRFDFDRTIIGDTVEEVVASEPQLCRCLTVEEDSSFVANGFIVHNTTVCSIAWPAWTWTRRWPSFWSGPKVKFLSASYNNSLALENSNKTRRLIGSPFYQQRWGKDFQILEDQNSKVQFDNSAGGSRVATSVGGSLLGLGGDIICVDDPLNTAGVESEKERQTALDWWSEIRSTRLNNPKLSALVVVMQRLHENDISGFIQDGDDYDDWTHLMLPMRHDERRHCVTVLKRDKDGTPLEVFEDPRVEDGELLWPERFGEQQVKALEEALGPYFASGRLQQRPTPKGGSIFERDWWVLWEAPDGRFPAFEYIVASLDSAFTAKEENDPSALTVWGVFKDDKGQSRIMLIHAWRKHLQFHGPDVEKEKGESDFMFRRRAQKVWGLVETVADTCNRFKVDRLLIEAKASGITAAQELGRLHGREGWAIQLCTVKGDKVARAMAAQATFAQGLIYAPERDWSEMVISEMEMFPKGKFDDLTDSATQAIKHLRDGGMANTDAEEQAEINEGLMLRKRPVPLYPC